jgi:hypothetical protein
MPRPKTARPGFRIPSRTGSYSITHSTQDRAANLHDSERNRQASDTQDQRAHQHEEVNAQREDARERETKQQEQDGSKQVLSAITALTGEVQKLAQRVDQISPGSGPRRMIRGTWVWDRQNQKLVEKHLYRDLPVARSDLPSPMIISDQMDVTMNPANGRRYDSKRAYQKAVRAAGCEILGNEKPSASPRPQLDDPGNDIKQAIEQLGVTV